jgi:uncharacterized protein (DUF58 family)
MDLDADTINRATALGLAARFVVDGHMAGEHRSPFRGVSVEFVQHRPYAPGDDTRRLDHKVLGRTDRLVVKQYEQETNFVAHLLVDGSDSMRYRSADGPAAKGLPPAQLSKFDYARGMAACLAYVVLRQRDAVAATVFDTAARHHVPRTSTLAGLGDLMTVLANARPASHTGIGDVLHAAAATVRRRGIVLLLSDLLDDEDKTLAGLRHLRFGGSEVVVFHVLDPYERQFPFAGNVRFTGLEQYAADVPLKTRPADVRRSYLSNLTAFCDRIRAGCERHGCHYVPVDTGQPMAEVLGAYLASRRAGGSPKLETRRSNE